MKPKTRQAATDQAWAEYGGMCQGARAKQQMIVKLAGESFERQVAPVRKTYQLTVELADREMHDTARRADIALRARLREIG